LDKGVGIIGPLVAAPGNVLIGSIIFKHDRNQRGRYPFFLNG
jgi:hypothetical protein|tara:strand:+ start:1131 stop:1256 length:126 start_codon:yes stop_codon:yes gene_type:complete